MSSHVTIGNVTVDLNNYTCYYKGLLLPLVSEYTWGHGVRAFLYLLGLLWIFMAVAIIADVFMCSIERITSKTTTIRIADPEAETGYREMEVKVWNNTVANLSLLAFGTSAPEILLSVIETIGGGFKAGELGPGTIVGSAAFNLLVISGICVMSIPSPDTRRIAGIKVFFVTGFTSIFAYIWIAIVLMVSSPGVVDIWEAVVTLALFPLLIAVAYLADRNFCMGKKDEQPSGMVGVPLVNGLDEMTGSGDTENDLNRLVKELGQSVRDGDISESEAVKIATARMNEDQSHDRGWYRINAMRMLTGSRKLLPRVMSNFQELYDNIKLSSGKEGHTGPNGHNAGGTNAVVEFTAKSIGVVENGGKVRVGIRRFGNTNISCTVHVETINGTAIAVEDYKSFSEDVIFDQHEELRQVDIEIVDDTEWEPDEFFFVKLSVPQGETNVVKGSVSICQIIIINDDVNGLDEPTGSGDPENDLNRRMKELGHSVRDGDIPESEATKIATARMNEDQSHDRGWYRINATRMLTGGRKLIPRVMSNSQKLYRQYKLSNEGHTGPKDHNAGGTNAVVEFTAASLSVMENGGKVRVGIRRYGNTNISCTVHVETINGTAIAVEDYKSFSEDVIFDQHEELRQVYIEIVDDTEWEPDEFFFVKLSVPQGETNVVKGSVSICQIIIINDDVNGLDEPTGSGDPENDLNRRMKELGHSVRDGDIPESEAAKIATARMNEDQSHDRGWYRINATRMLTGDRKLVPRVMSNFQKLYRQYKLSNEGHTGPKDHNAGGTNAVVGFTAKSLSVMENGGKVRVGIRRYGNTNTSCTVHVETINGTAIAVEDYKSFSEDVVFSNAQTTLRQVYIEIVDDYEWEPDEFFFVKLSVPQGETDVVIGSVSICHITIINDDGPGELEFDKPSFVVKESYYTARVPVNRVNGCDGHVSVKWATSDITAREGIDYKGKEGILMFDNQEASKTIDIPLLESKKKERDVCFAIELGETDGGAELGKIKKTTVTIVNDDDFDGIDSRLLDMTKANVGAMALTSHRWIDQFKEAMNVNGGDIESASFLDYVLHFLTFGWKLIFAFLPPAKYLGGWPCFILSLFCIGILTTIINDLAGTFGCLIGMEDSITAITFVALGTSMPDTFASKTAAIMEKTADSSVGNINGSNSVNVFLGLGLSWTIASIYWAAKGEQFDYPAKSLGFSVIIYSSCAVVALGILLLRRYTSVFGRAELGGPRIPKIISGIVLISLWVFYIMMSVLQVKGVITVSF